MITVTDVPNAWWAASRKEAPRLSIWSGRRHWSVTLIQTSCGAIAKNGRKQAMTTATKTAAQTGRLPRAAPPPGLEERDREEDDGVDLGRDGEPEHAGAES